MRGERGRMLIHDDGKKLKRVLHKLFKLRYKIDQLQRAESQLIEEIIKKHGFDNFDHFKTFYKTWEGHKAKDGFIQEEHMQDYERRKTEAYNKVH